MTPASLSSFFNYPAVQIAVPIIAVIAVIFAVLGLIAFTLLERRLSRLTGGAHGNIEESLKSLSKDMKELQIFRTELESYLKVAEMRLRGAVQGVGTVRFNPFQGDGSGGNQSFSICFLDEFGNGVVLSTLYARDRVGVYCKPVENGASQFETSQEEREAIDMARKNIAEHKKK
ncbi:DUF4446 family protein [Candidatus Parcubacteria bacterium]|nr:DUF4446 family protein [Candidatus Parcubacteria bacterium]